MPNIGTSKGVTSVVDLYKFPFGKMTSNSHFDPGFILKTFETLYN